MPLVWAGRIALGLIGVKLVSDAEDITESLTKAAPWVAAGLLAYVVIKGAR